jgi:hypothetical protein
MWVKSDQSFCSWRKKGKKLRHFFARLAVFFNFTVKIFLEKVIYLCD